MKRREMEKTATESPVEGRRAVLRGAVGGFLGLALVQSPSNVLAAIPGAPDKMLNLSNLHTGERARTVFWSEGEFVAEGLREINRVLRDHRTGEIAGIDPNLLLLVHDLCHTLETCAPIGIISGYRSQRTNDALRKASNGVAKKSYHMRGMAMDIRIPGIPLKQARKAAVSLRKGGVGYYPKSNFLHLDTGPVRQWR